MDGICLLLGMLSHRIFEPALCVILHEVGGPFNCTGEISSGNQAQIVWARLVRRFQGCVFVVRGRANSHNFTPDAAGRHPLRKRTT